VHVRHARECRKMKRVPGVTEADDRDAERRSH
jgi:hypothetical protein